MLVLTSPLQRARRTAELVGLAAFGSVETDDDLVEWDYGKAEGRTRIEILADVPGWSIWTHGAPGGESPAEIGARMDRVLTKIRPLVLSGVMTGASTPGGQADGSDRADPLVVIVGHGHALRVLAARWLGLEPAAGALFRLDTAALSILGFEHDQPVLRAWNVAAI